MQVLLFSETKTSDIGTGVGALCSMLSYDVKWLLSVEGWFS